MSGGAELAGALSERVMIMKPGGQDAGGAALPFIEEAMVWAAVVPERAGVDVRGERLSAFPRFAVTVRAHVAIDVGDRLHWREDELRVLSVMDDPRWPDRLHIVAERQR